MRVLSVLAVSLGLAGCASASAGGARSDTGQEGRAGALETDGSAYIRVIDAIEVRDEHGAPYPFPFLGGLDVPRPQFVDIDADGDLDLFIQERGNELIYFENVGTPQQWRFEWRTDAYPGLDIGEWSRFADLDGDGDYDALGEEMFSYVRYYRNEGTPSQAAFVLAADSVRDPNGTPVFADRQNIPAIVDWDCPSRVASRTGMLSTTTRVRSNPRPKYGVSFSL